MLDAASAVRTRRPRRSGQSWPCQYENLLVYFLFRYALKAVNDRQLSGAGRSSACFICSACASLAQMLQRCRN